MRKIIFHIPQEIDTTNPAGSNIRPVKLLEGFKQAGIEVSLVWGNGAARKKAIEKVKQEITNGVKFEFLYSESSTMPTLLTEKNHLPTYPFLDFGFFKYCKQQNIPIGLFYRDVYWKFPFYKPGFFYKILATSMYQYDLHQYSKLLDILFLPSDEMGEYVPVAKKVKKIELPPGVSEIRTKKESVGQPLQIFYVGGLGAVYQLQEFVKAVAQTPEVVFTMCTRKNEWEAHKHVYEPFLAENIKVVHKSGKELASEYEKADVTCLALEPSTYRVFCFPVKVFEYLGWQRPILAIKGTKVGDFVAQNKIGWEANYNAADLAQLLQFLVANPTEIKQKQENMSAIVARHTWKERAKEIIDHFKV